jgi:hypothetical protein
MKKATSRTTAPASLKEVTPVALPVEVETKQDTSISLEKLPELAPRKTSTSIERIDALEARLEALIAQLSK